MSALPVLKICTGCKDTGNNKNRPLGRFFCHICRKQNRNLPVPVLSADIYKPLVLSSLYEAVKIAPMNNARMRTTIQNLWDIPNKITSCAASPAAERNISYTSD